MIDNLKNYRRIKTSCVTFLRCLVVISRLTIGFFVSFLPTSKDIKFSNLKLHYSKGIVVLALKT